MRAFFLALGLMGTPAMAAEQFDLICKSSSGSEQYRIDLDRGEWCFGNCSRVMHIASVTSGVISLIENEPAPPLNETIYNRINRTTGAWEWYNHSPRLGGIVQDIKGQCTAADFSGFPKTKF